MSKRRSLCFVILFILFFVPACNQQPHPVAVAPVTGLPQGTDNYPWWNDSVFYEIFVRSFYDSNGDGIGDLNGILQKLDYLNDGNPQTNQDLGITGIWLMPIHPSPSYHGYDVTDYYNINPDYGTLDDFKNLLAEAHKRGIRIIIDFVLNHTSDQHPWFVASQDPGSPYRRWYLWSDTDPGSYWHTGKTGYYYGFFGANMPDLNYTDTDVTKEMENVARFWLQDVGVDGFRLDAAKHLIESGSVTENTPATHAWYQQFRPFYKGINPQAMTVGEVQGISAMAGSYSQGDQLDLTFDFDLAQAIIVSVRTQDNSQLNRVLAADLGIFKPGQYATFLSNHDQNRVISQLANDLSRVRSAAAVLFSLPGVPFMYYGEEVGMRGVKPDEQIRTPMNWSSAANGGFTSGTPWEPLTVDYQEKRDVADQTDDANSLLSLYRSLIQARNQHAALRVGDFEFVSSDNPAIFAGLRSSPSEKVLVLVNLSKEPVTNFQLSMEKSGLQGSYRMVPLWGQDRLIDLKVDAGGGFDGYKPVQSLAGNGSLFIQLEAAK